MSARTRRSVVGFLIALYVAWPFVQQQLALRARIDPWKLAGWGMYSVTSARVRISLTGLDSAQRRVLINPRSSANLAAIVEDFGSRRRTLGLFLKPDGVAHKLAQTFPDYREWSVVVDQIGLTPENRFGVIHRAVYRYPNSEDSTPGKLGQMDVRYPPLYRLASPSAPSGDLPLQRSEADAD